MSGLTGQLLIAGSLVSQNLNNTNKIFEQANKAARNKLMQIEQALLDVLNGTDMTAYTFNQNDASSKSSS